MAAADPYFLRYGARPGRRPSRLARPKRPGERLRVTAKVSSLGRNLLVNLIGKRSGQLNVDDGYDPMTPVDDYDLVADDEVEIAAPCRMIPDDHFGDCNDMDALGHHRSGR